MTKQPISDANLIALYDAVFETIKRHLEQRTEKIEASAYVEPDRRAREAMKNDALAAMCKVINGTKKAKPGGV